MCGVCGFVSGQEPLSSERAAALLASLRHRGPDSSGEYRDGHVWLGHTRLKILDLTDCGRQPMATRDGRFVISYNGETYNHQQLAQELRLTGLRSRTDTEIVLRAFECEGPASFARLNGIFAFAIYDRVERKLWLVRDRIGVKPLYYRLASGAFAFGSEIKAILASTETAPICNTTALHEWLYYGNTLGGGTLYQEIHQVEPGHYLELDVDTLATRAGSYWRLADEAAAATEPGDTRHTIAEARRRLEEAVRRQLMSDVPVGVFLSGGIDSSAVAAFAARHYVGKLTTYSAGFDGGSQHDERPVARRTAAFLGTDHHELHVGSADVPAVIEKMVEHHDAPFSDAANIPLFLMASQISGTTKVVLQGDGGDEVFGGYRRYTTMGYYRWLRPMAMAAGPVNALGPRTALQRRAARYLRALTAPAIAETMARLLTLDDPRDCPAAVFSMDMRRQLHKSDPFARYRDMQSRFAAHDLANQMLLVDLMIELPDVFLEKVDRATMAAAVEVRVPFLDNDLVSFAARLPGFVKMPRGQKKWLLRQALSGLVPDEVLHGPKVGFNVPFGYWLRTSLKDFFHAQLDTFMRKHPGVLDAARIRSAHHEYEERRHDRSFLLWKVLNFMVWANRRSIQIPGLAAST